MTCDPRRPRLPGSVKIRFPAGVFNLDGLTLRMRKDEKWAKTLSMSFGGEGPVWRQLARDTNPIVTEELESGHQPAWEQAFRLPGGGFVKMADGRVINFVFAYRFAYSNLSDIRVDGFSAKMSVSGVSGCWETPEVMIWLEKTLGAETFKRHRFAYLAAV